MDKIVKGYPNWDVPLNKNIDEYNETIGNAELLTKDKTVKGSINEIKTENNEVIKKIKDDTQVNTADISNLKTSVAKNTAQLNDITQEISNLQTDKQDMLPDTGWVDLPLNNATAGNITPKYRKWANDLILDGRITGMTSAGGTVGTLPVGCRPISPKVCVCATDSDGLYIRVVINVGGTITIPASSGLTSSITIYLDSIMVKCS